MDIIRKATKDDVYDILKINVDSYLTTYDGIIPKKINANLAFTVNDIISEKISIRGVLTTILINIWNAICIFVTSVVSLVIILDVLNLSIFLNEKSCIL